jgi:ribosome biogenesis protein ENP2
VFILHSLGKHSVSAQIAFLCLFHTLQSCCIITRAPWLQVLTEDYSKSVFLCSDRSLIFHTRMGKHVSLRVPKSGRDLAYLPSTTEVVVGGRAAELWRISLYEGRFMQPLEVQMPAVNALGVCPTHGMLAAGGEEGVVECFDARTQRSLSHHNVAAEMGCGQEDVTAVRFNRSGLHLAVGTSGLLPLSCIASVHRKGAWQILQL